MSFSCAKRKGMSPEEWHLPPPPSLSSLSVTGIHVRSQVYALTLLSRQKDFLYICFCRIGLRWNRIGMTMSISRVHLLGHLFVVERISLFRYFDIFCLIISSPFIVSVCVYDVLSNRRLTPSYPLSSWLFKRRRWRWWNGFHWLEFYPSSWMRLLSCWLNTAQNVHPSPMLRMKKPSWWWWSE